jgi:putative FmdB family regulatory protein
MPIYEFVCNDCGKPFESLVLGFTTENVKCPECNSGMVKKKVSSFSFSGNSVSVSDYNFGTSCNTGST